MACNRLKREKRRRKRKAADLFIILVSRSAYCFEVYLLVVD